MVKTRLGSGIEWTLIVNSWSTWVVDIWSVSPDILGSCELFECPSYKLRNWLMILAFRIGPDFGIKLLSSKKPEQYLTVPKIPEIFFFIFRNSTFPWPWQLCEHPFSCDQPNHPNPKNVQIFKSVGNNGHSLMQFNMIEILLLTCLVSDTRSFGSDEKCVLRKWTHAKRHIMHCNLFQKFIFNGCK